MNRYHALELRCMALAGRYRIFLSLFLTQSVPGLHIVSLTVSQSNSSAIYWLYSSSSIYWLIYKKSHAYLEQIPKNPHVPQPRIKFPNHLHYYFFRLLHQCLPPSILNLHVNFAYLNLNSSFGDYLFIDHKCLVSFSSRANKSCHIIRAMP